MVGIVLPVPPLVTCSEILGSFSYRAVGLCLSVSSTSMARDCLAVSLHRCWNLGIVAGFWLYSLKVKH